MKLEDDEGKMFHIQIKPEDIGEYVLLPGDPKRCMKIAKHFDDAKLIGDNREYIIYTGFLDGVKVSVCSTGIGGPSTAIAVEELYNCGARKLIRVGTCGGINLNVKSGDIVIAQAAVRMDGTSREYAPIEFPAVGNINILNSLIEACENLAYNYHTGIVQTKDSFYGQHKPEEMATSHELKEKWDSWKKLGVLASEMECATLYTVSSHLNIEAGCILLCLLNQEIDKENNQNPSIENCIETAIEALRLLIKKSKDR